MLFGTYLAYAQYKYFIPDEPGVDEGGTVVVDHPEQEATLDQRVEGNPEENIVREEFQDAEIAERR